MFITIDGGDGSGKGTQISLLKEWFSKRGLNFAFFRDPGDTELGESLRNILLERKELSICSKAETALFMASRAQLVQEKIAPALRESKLVLVDRYLLSTIVYQGYAAGAMESEVERIWDVGAFLADYILPEIALVLDCPVEIALQRLNRDKDRIESKGVDYHRRVLEGYRKAVSLWKNRTKGEIFLIDATLSPSNVFERIREILEPRLFSRETKR